MASSLLLARPLAQAQTPQMPDWLFSATLVDFSTGTPQTANITAGTNNRVSAAALNGPKDLVFYVNRSNPMATVYSAANQAIGNLNYITNPNKQFDETDWAGLGKEMVVAPVPGVCSQYYLFYTLSGNYSTVLASALIDCSSGMPVIRQNSQLVDNTLYYPAPGLAASSPNTTNGNRTLYVAGGTAVKSYSILYGGGLGSATTVKPGSFSGGSCEAELSSDGNYLAWAPQGYGLSQVTLFNIITGIPVTINPLTASGTALGAISGLEFSRGGYELFVTGQNGAVVYTLASQTQAPIATGSNTLAGNTQIELASDGLLYAASSTGRMLSIDPSSRTVALAPPTFAITPLGGSGVGSNVYGFPDQIDGENYAAYFGDYPPRIDADIQVDGAGAPNTSPQPVFSCNPLRLLAGSSSNLSRLDITISSTDATGNPNGRYSSTTTTFAPASPIDLRLTTLDNGYLADPNNAGYYEVLLVGYNACGKGTKVAKLLQISNLTPSSAGYAFNLCAGTGPQAGSTSPTAPAALGAYGGGGIDISFSTGDYDSYQVEFARLVPGSSPAQYQVIGTTPYITKPTTAAALRTVFLTYLAGQAGLTPSYFSAGNPGYNQVHRLVLTVRNACGTSPRLPGYFQTSNITCRPAQVSEASATDPLYPNPLAGADTGHLRFALPTAQPVSLVLTDALTGQVRLTVLRDALRPAGAQEVTFNAAQLPAGVYLYRLTTAAGTKVGRLLKAD